MVASSQRRFILAFLALLAALAVTGCARPMGLGPDVRGSRRAIRLTMPKRAVTSTYERTPALEWRRYAVGQPSAPAFSHFRGPGASCALVPQGLTRVLALPEGSPMRDIQELGPLTLGVAGSPVTDVGAFSPFGGGPGAQSLLEGISRLGTQGDACSRSVFAYVRLGLGANDDPVAVSK